MNFIYEGVDQMKGLNLYKENKFVLIRELIKDEGYKLTEQRGEVLKEFIKKEGTHLSAKSIYDSLHCKGIGISTVYRNLNLFVNLRILTEFKVDDTNYYELKIYSKKPFHIHFKCEKCEDVKDIVDREIVLEHLQTSNLIEEKYSMEINDLDIMYHGLCGECVK